MSMNRFNWDTQKHDTTTHHDTFSIPFLPKQVNDDDINRDNQMLFSDDEIAFIKQHAADAKDGIYRYLDDKQKRYRLDFAVIKSGPDYYAIYRGIKHNKQLGRGGFGKVKLVQNLQTGEWHALKVQQINPNIDNEVYHLNGVNQLVLNSDQQYFSLKRTSVSKLRKQHYMLMKLGGKDLEYYCHVKNAIPPKLWLQMALGAAKELQQLHHRNILHRDIKLDNFLFDYPTRSVKLIDYNFAKNTNNQGKAYSGNLMGTLGYVAREVFSSGVDDLFEFNRQTDVYALGVVLARLFGLVKKVDRRSHPAFSQMVLYKKQDSEFLKNPRLPMNKDEKIKLLNFVKRMLSDFPNCRPSIDEVVSFLNKRLHKCDKKKDSQYQIALIDIDDLQQIALQENGIKRLTNKLGALNQVQLVSQHRENDAVTLMHYKQLLEKAGLYVEDELLIGEKDKHALLHSLRHDHTKHGDSYQYTRLEYKREGYAKQKSAHTLQAFRLVALTDTLQSSQEKGHKTRDNGQGGFMHLLKGVGLFSGCRANTSTSPRRAVNSSSISLHLSSSTSKA